MYGQQHVSRYRRFSLASASSASLAASMKLIIERRIGDRMNRIGFVANTAVVWNLFRDRMHGGTDSGGDRTE